MSRHQYTYGYDLVRIRIDTSHINDPKPFWLDLLLHLIHRSL